MATHLLPMAIHLHLMVPLPRHPTVLRPCPASLLLSLANLLVLYVFIFSYCSLS